jgi:transaldolase
MIKVPATREGLPAIETLLGEGINVNITLIFAQGVYRAVAESYLNALEARAARGESLDAVASVASTFVSRIDTAVDDQLEALAASRPDAADEARDLLGQAAIANSKAVYQIFEEVFGGDRFQRLAARGARRQRPLWASTSTKNPAYPPTRYVDELIGPDTVNTMPENTMTAFRDTGEVQETVRADTDFWDEVLERLRRLGIDLDAVMDQLEDEGVQKFVDSYDELLADLDAKAASLRA